MTGEQLDAARRDAQRSLRGRFPRTPPVVIEDACASACLICWRRRDAIDTTSLDGYLYVVALHIVTKHLRSKYAATLSLDVEITVDAGDSVPWLNALPSRDDVLELVLARDRVRAIDDLRPHQRTALTTRLLGLSYAEACEATGRTHTWLNKHISKGRAALREMAA